MMSWVNAKKSSQLYGQRSLIETQQLVTQSFLPCHNYIKTFINSQTSDSNTVGSRNNWSKHSYVAIYIKSKPFIQYLSWRFLLSSLLLCGMAPCIPCLKVKAKYFTGWFITKQFYFKFRQQIFLYSKGNL